ncbi:hypothetical protein PV326_000913, partial [Microctonus aethiopoides]
MELRSAKQSKMSEDESNEPTPTSSDTKETDQKKFDETFSTFEYHYNRPDYIDKTLLIKELFEVRHVLITAPSRFGKSLNMDMVRRFVEIEIDEKGNPIKLNIDENARCLTEDQPQSKNYKLFHGKKISREKEIMYEHFGKYPTIYVDFSEVQGSNFEENLASLRTVIHDAFQEHAYLLKADLWNDEAFNKDDFMEYFDLKKSKLKTVEEIKTGLVLLSKFLHAHHGRKVFVFLEEFDVPVNTMVYENDMSLEDRKLTIKLLQTMTKKLLKGSEKTVVKSLSNACQQLGGILSRSANNVRLCPFMQNHSLVEYYGFNKHEVKELLERAGLCDHLNDVLEMYNGYKKELKNGDVEISSPWAIVQFIRTEEYAKYWSAGIPPEINRLIGNSKIRSKLTDMMSGESVRIEYHEKLHIDDITSLNNMVCKNELSDKDIDLSLQYLYEMGFFYPTHSEKDHLMLTVPNQSARTAINDALYKTEFMKEEFNYKPMAIKAFTDSTKNLAKSCEKRKDRTKAYARIKRCVRQFAENIKSLIMSGK